MRNGLGGRAAVAAACALLAISLAGGPLYVSSAASESVQIQLAGTCPSQSGLVVSWRGDHPLYRQTLESAAAGVADVAPSVSTTSVVATFSVAGNATPTRFVLLDRQGAESAVVPPLATIGAGEAVVPDYLPGLEHFVVGDTLTVSDTLGAPRDDSGSPTGPAPTTDLVAVAAYAAFPLQPIPTFWCGVAALFEPNAGGDRPPPVLLTSATTVASFPVSQINSWELRPQGTHLTRDDARRLEAEFSRIAAAFDGAAGPNVTNQRLRPTVSSGMDDIVARAESVAEVVGRTMAPVRLAGVLAASFVLAAAAAMIARERRRELRLLAVRGVGPGASAIRLWRRVAVPCVLGGGIGFGVALLGVRTLGPTPELEHGPMRAAVTATVIGVLAATVLVAVVAARLGDRLVDGRPRRHWAQRVPVELVVVVLAVLAYRHLDQVGGVRLLGTHDARGGDLLAQAFPLLAISAPLAVLARPLRWLATRARTRGQRLPETVRLGVRRAVAEPGLVAMLVVATALASGCMVLSSTLTTSAHQELTDKATTYIGSDEAVRVVDDVVLPPSLSEHATNVGTYSIQNGGQSVTVLGVDPATFAGAVHWRGDASSHSLASLMDLITTAADDDAPAVPAIRVGPVDDADLTIGSAMHALVVATATFFPGFRTATSMLVVDLAALRASGLPMSHAVWVRDPPDDLVAQLTAAGGVRIGGQQVSQVFDVASFRAVGWSYSALSAFAALIAVVVLMMQLLVIDARLESRRTSQVMMGRMGFSRRRLLVATIVELGIPLVLGVLLGFVVGAVSASASVPRLDTLRSVPPPAIAVADLGAYLGVAFAAVVALVVLTMISATSTLRAEPMEVMRGTA